MATTDLVELAEQERAALLALVRTLTDEQWATTSLCSAWTVRDVAVHVVSYDPLGILGTVTTFLGGDPRVAAVNARALDRYADLTPSDVVDLVAQCQRPRGLTAALGGRIALTDGTIHHQDIRRSLALPRTIPEAQLQAALDFALRAPTLPAGRNARGLRLEATDLDWGHGTGQPVSGPAEAILMAVAGRPDALADLQGAGLRTLRARLGA